LTLEIMAKEKELDYANAEFYRKRTVMLEIF
jgi:hypothetical protein